MAQRGASEAVFSVNLKGCEVTPEINLGQNKYQIKLEIPSAEGMTEMWLRCDSVRTYEALAGVGCFGTLIQI